MKSVLLTLLVPLFLWTMVASGQSTAVVKNNKQTITHKVTRTQAENQVPVRTTNRRVSNAPAIKNQAPSMAPLAWVTTWVFSQTSGTYSAISGGTTMGTTANDEEVFGPYNIGFNFSYNGTVYTQFSVATNGFIGLGSSVVATSALPISGGTSNNIISALGVDLQAQTGSSLQYLLTGTAPNQTMVIQWTNYRKKSATGDVFNFQIRLNQSDNSIVVVYNGFTVNATNSTVQVGIRGGSSADYNNRSIGASQTWATSIAGTVNTANCRLRSTTFPANGQTYTWAPLNCNVSTFPYNEDFSATLNPCWSIAQVSGTTNWTMATSISYPDLVPVYTLTPQSGTHLAKFDSYNAVAGTSSRLKTATFDFTSLTSPSVEFWMAQDAQYTNTDTINVQVSTNGGATWTTITPPFYRYNPAFTTPGWQKYTAYLPAYAGQSNVTLAFLATSQYGNMMAIDNVTVKQGLTDDVGTVGVWAATKLPKGQDYKWWTLVKNFAPNTETFDVDTKLRVNGSPVVTTTNTVTSLPFNYLAEISGAFNISSYASGSTFDILNQTKLPIDQNTANDIMINSARACTNDTIYAWDDGVSEGSLGYNTGTGWLGQLYYLSTQDTLTSITVKWGTIPGAIAGNSIEIFNVSGGLPSTKFSDIVTGINLSTSDQDTYKTYKPTSPIILPAGTYWIGAHQSVALAGTYLIATDESGLSSDNYIPGFAFYSSTGTSWTDYFDAGINSINVIRPNFANIAGTFVSNPTSFVATPVSSTQVNLSWLLNANSNNVLLAWSPTGTFGTPANGTVYSAGNSIPGGGTVLQYNGLTSFSHTGLNPNTPYYYKAWSYNGSAYSGGAVASAQTFCAETPAPWSEDFETATFPPSCWDINTGGSQWARSTAASSYGGGTASAIAEFFNINSAIPFALFTLPFNNGSLQAPNLTFDYAYATYSGEPDELDIYYSTDGGLNFSLLYEMPGGTNGILNTGGTSTTAFVPTAAQWATKTLTLPTGTNMVAFNAISAYGNNLYLDNIKIIEGLLHDVSVTKLDARQVYPSGTVTPVATVSNYGGVTETFNVNMVIGTYTSTKSVTLGAGLSQVVTFDPWTNATGDYAMQVCTLLGSDLNNTNNCMSHAVKVMPLNKQVYGYNTFPGTGTDPEGPTSFNLASPGTLNSIADQTAQQFLTAGTWANGTWYATVYNTVAPYNLITVDPATGARTVIGDMGVALTGLSYNKANGIMYGVNATSLYTVDMTTGLATLVGTNTGTSMINLAINSGGAAYALDMATDNLGTVNLTTGVFTAIGPVGFSAQYAQDMEFDRETGELFMAAQDAVSGWLAWVNTSTGATMKIDDFEGGAEITGFAIPYSDNKSLSIKVLFEGLYNGAGGLNQAYDESGPHYGAGISDKVTLELRNSSTGALEYTVSNADLSTGGIVTGTIPAAHNGSYYIYVKHRNSITTSTANPVSFSGSSISYDFSTGLAQAFGGNMQNISGTALVYSGDENQDGLIDSSDMIDADNDAANFVTGYVVTDITGDGLVDSSDMILIDNNTGAFVAAVLPF